MGIVEKGKYIYSRETIKNGENEVGYQDIFKGTIYNIQLDTNKNSIQSDGVDEATITAKVYDYNGNFISDPTDEITFVLEGEGTSDSLVVPFVDGVASIQFDSLTEGTFNIIAHYDVYRSDILEVEVI